MSWSSRRGPAGLLRQRSARRLRAVLLWLSCLWCASLIAWPRAAWAQTPFPALADLVGKQITVQLRDGGVLEDVEVAQLKKAKESDRFLGLIVKTAKPRRAHTVWAPAIAELYCDSRPLGISFDPKTRTIGQDFHRPDEAMAHDRKTQVRLVQKGKQLWPTVTDEQQAAWLARQKAFLQNVGTQMAPLQFQLAETEYFLFFTDIPPQQVRLMVGYLDAMYHELAKAFRIPPSTNIWCGKCVVLAFQSQPEFQAF